MYEKQPGKYTEKEKGKYAEKPIAELYLKQEIKPVYKPSSC